MAGRDDPEVRGIVGLGHEEGRLRTIGTSAGHSRMVPRGRHLHLFDRFPERTRIVHEIEAEGKREDRCLWVALDRDTRAEDKLITRLSCACCRATAARGRGTSVEATTDIVSPAQGVARASVAPIDSRESWRCRGVLL